MKALASAMAQGHTPNLQELHLVSVRRGREGEKKDGGGEEHVEGGGRDAERGLWVRDACDR
eukprot:306417-Rhodomonas_salina.1